MPRPILIALAAATALAIAYASAAMLGVAPGSGPAEGLLAPEGGRDADVGGPFSLLDHTGQRVSDRDFYGRRMLVLFGASTEEGLARSGLQVMAAVLDELGPAAKGVAAVFVSLDPAPRAPGDLAAAIAAIDRRIIGLTGEPHALQALARAYHVAQKPLHGAESRIVPDPARILYVMDERGAFQFHVPMPSSPRAIADRLTAGR